MPFVLPLYSTLHTTYPSSSRSFLSPTSSSLLKRGSTGEIGEAAAKTASNFGTAPMAITIVSVVLLVVAIVAAMSKYNKKHPWKGADETGTKDLAGNDPDSLSNSDPAPQPAPPTSAQVAADSEGVNGSSASETIIHPEASQKQDKPEQKLRWFIGFEK
ncbi:hypothetical protein R3P38DRAFT_2796078 [Favolaschia claudopus]|uniref:Transmembrane protein n=1 Tax=Favolaschia claudopus TaxID=2862362 RepID=A0AAW0A654_9AGAR